MISYKISPEKGRAERSAALKRNAAIISVALALAILLTGGSALQGQSTRFLIVWSVIMGAFFTFVLFRVLRQTSRFLDEAYSTFELTVADGLYTKKQKDTPDVSIARAEVRGIEEKQGKGFRIRTGERARNIWVPWELDGYEELKAELATIPGIEVKSTPRAWLRSYIALAAFLLVFAISILATDKRVAALCNLLLAAYMFAYFVKHYRNPNLTARGRRQILLFGFAGVYMLVRAILVAGWWR